MSILERWLGEDAWSLVGLLALVALGLAIAMVSTGRARFLIGIVTLAVVAVVVLIIEQAWVTDREQVDGVISDLARAAVREDAPGVVRHLSPACRYGNLDRTGIERLASATFSRFAIDRVNVSSRKTEVFPLRREAQADFLAVVRGRQNNVDFSPYPTRWILTFVQNSDGVWQVDAIQQIPALGDSRQPLAPPSGAL